MRCLWFGKMSTTLFVLLVLLFCGTYFEGETYECSNITSWLIKISYDLIVSGLRCWDCRSDGINSSFCGDYFDKDLISEQQRSYVYVNCTVPESIKNPLAVPKIAVCRVMKQTGKMLCTHSLQVKLIAKNSLQRILQQ